MEEKIAFSPVEAAKVADTNKNRIYEAINKGDLIAYKAGRRTFIMRDDLLLWLRNMPRYARGAA